MEEPKPIAQLTDAELAEEAERAEQAAHGYKVITTWDLAAMEFPELRWIVPDICPEGLVLLSGPPKVGKTIFAVSLATSLTTGVQFFGKQLERQAVLYLALEYSQRNFRWLFDRIKALPSKEFHIMFREHFSAESKLEQLAHFVERHREVSVVFVDTFGLFKAQNVFGKQEYDYDIAELKKIKDFCNAYDVSVVLVHHTRKTASVRDDPLEELYGSFGVGGACDTSLILKRPRKAVQGELHVIGREIQDKELALGFDAAGGGWTLLGDAEEYRLSEARREILSAVGDETMSIKGIAEALSKNYNTTAQLVRRLSQGGFLLRTKNGYSKV